jgi:hypothetical protein
MDLTQPLGGGMRTGRSGAAWDIAFPTEAPAAFTDATPRGPVRSVLCRCCEAKSFAGQARRATQMCVPRRPRADGSEVVSGRTLRQRAGSIRARCGGAPGGLFSAALAVRGESDRRPNR